MLGFLLTAASLPVLTAGAAVGTASEAVRHFLAYDSWPPAAVVRTTFRRRLVPGLWAGPAVLAGLALVVVDLAGLRHGLVPGGSVVLAVILLAAVLAAGWTALVAVLAGAPLDGVPLDGAQCADAPRAGAPLAAARLASAHPPLLLAATGVVLVAALLAFFVHPALIPILAGFVLFALHAVTVRLHPPTIINSDNLIVDDRGLLR